MKIKNKTVYEYVVTDGYKICLRKMIDITATTAVFNGREYYVVYDEDYKLDYVVFDFLNFNLTQKSSNSRNQSMEAIKFLKCFETIIGKKIKDFNLHDANLLKAFLRGESYAGRDMTINLITSRSSQSINMYAGVYRQYLKYLGIENSVISDFRNNTVYPWKKEVGRNQRFSFSETVVSREEIPAYISLDEFVTILQIIRKKYSIREEIIVRLMYEAGMRIGEVLGLTFDDVRLIKEKGKYIPTVYIRNRASDNKYQRAKSVMTITDSSQYAMPEYYMKELGFQNVYISQELYDLIDEYINEFHEKAREENKELYFEYATADCVDNMSEYGDTNCYIFINNKGKRLNGKNWNDILKRIYEEAGIHIDKDKKRHNLSHRFRHGFAMFQVQYADNKDPVSLKQLMRHKNVETVKIYLRFTVEDIVNIKTSYINHLYELVPGLKNNI